MVEMIKANGTNPCGKVTWKPASKVVFLLWLVLS